MPAHVGQPVEVDGVAGEISKDGNTLVMECLRMELGEPDASGRKHPGPVNGSEFNIACDTVIAAIGQMPAIPAGFDLEPIAGGIIKVNSETLATSIDGLFAGGDVATGPAPR